MAEFTSLNGYQVKDTIARSIAKGRNQAVAFVDYATMIETLNEFEKDEYRAGQNVYIGVVGVPDLWVYSVEDIRHTFTYTSDEDFVEMLKSNTTVQVGFFKLAMLEGQKVDLTTVNEQLTEHTNDIAEINTEIGELNSSLGNLKFGYDIETEKYGYYVTDSEGADTFHPFNNFKYIVENVPLETKTTYVMPVDGLFVVFYYAKTGDNTDAYVAINNSTVHKTGTYTAQKQLLSYDCKKGDIINVFVPVSSTSSNYGKVLYPVYN